jgi:uncharacterized protein
LNQIRVEHHPDPERLQSDGVFDWPVWTKEVSEFVWNYDETETCYFLEGDAVVTPRDGRPVEIGKGDLVTFPSGMSCKWKVRKPVRKHYRFG